MHSSRTTHSIKQKQRGAAFIVMLVILIMGVAAFLVSSLSSSALQIKRDQVTADVLAQAKEALIGYAVTVQISSSNAVNQPRPGDLPCPDLHAPGSAMEGTPSTPCDSQAQRLGRLPWKTLGLPDLRDSSGERLWYAVSNNFKNSSRIGTLNSDTLGSISVFSSNGTLLNDGGNTTGVVAVVIAPGDVLSRQGGSLQDRSTTGNTIASNYLDVATIGGNTVDNANFTDGSSTNGFIQGRIKDTSGNLIVNDQLIAITQDNIMQPVQKRVAGEVKQCLIEYALINNSRYPWAVPLTDFSYQDNSDQLFGRIPDDLGNTNSDSGGGIIMRDKWGPMCNTHNNNIPATWWLNWREMAFYGLANAYKPVDPPNIPAANACASVGSCLSVTPTSPATDKKFVVIIAGKMLSTQLLRNSNKTDVTFYLEGGNQNADQSGAYIFTQGPSSSTFNDTVTFQ